MKISLTTICALLLAASLASAGTISPFSFSSNSSSYWSGGNSTTNTYTDPMFNNLWGSGSTYNGNSYAGRGVYLNSDGSFGITRQNGQYNENDPYQFSAATWTEPDYSGYSNYNESEQHINSLNNFLGLFGFGGLITDITEAGQYSLDAMNSSSVVDSSFPGGTYHFDSTSNSLSSSSTNTFATSSFPGTWDNIDPQRLTDFMYGDIGNPADLLSFGPVVTPTPEPGTIALFGFGVAGLIAGSFRRRRA